MDAADSSAFSLTFAGTFICLFAAALAAEMSAQDAESLQTALHPFLDLHRSTFTKNDDFIFDVLGEGLITYLKKRRVFKNSTIFESTGSLYLLTSIVEYSSK